MNLAKLGLWKAMKGPLQWRALWLAHDKFIVGVSGVILNQEQKILLLRHTYWPEGSWGLPSGYAESGERLENTLKREVSEETGYEIEVGELLRLVSGYKLRIEATYKAKLIGGNLNLDPKEVLEARFFPMSETPKGLLDTHRSIIETVKNPSKERK
jgi:ADP-ribose pyrophosphatase YjhB (NUDIX family)